MLPNSFCSSHNHFMWQSIDGPSHHCCEVIFQASVRSRHGSPVWWSSPTFSSTFEKALSVLRGAFRGSSWQRQILAIITIRPQESIWALIIGLNEIVKFVTCCLVYPPLVHRSNAGARQNIFYRCLWMSCMCLQSNYGDNWWWGWDIAKMAEERWIPESGEKL